MAQRPMFGGRYRLEQKSGEGGAAVVYRGTDEVLNRPVAIKILREHFSPDKSDSAEMLDRFRREARAIARLSHPNIINIYDVGDERGMPYIIMEYVDGENLKELLRRAGTLPPSRAIDLIGQVLDGLAYAHKHGIVHRDIKPQNILINELGLVKVTDFGIARIVEETTTGQSPAGQVLGTVEYMSPEQASGERATPASDIYSTGAVLYELLTGRPPFQAASPVALAYKHVHEAPPVASLVNPQISHSLNMVVMRALAKKPEQRFAGAEGMHQALRAIATESSGVTSAMPSIPPQETYVPAGTAIAPAIQFMPPQQRVSRWHLNSLPLLIAALALVLVTYGILNSLSGVTLFGFSTLSRPTRTPSDAPTPTQQIALVVTAPAVTTTVSLFPTAGYQNQIPTTTPIPTGTPLTSPTVTGGVVPVSTTIPSPTTMTGTPVVTETPFITATPASGSTPTPGTTPTMTETPLPPTETPLPPTETPVPTATPTRPPTATPVPVQIATSTPVPRVPFALGGNTATYFTDNVIDNEVTIHVTDAGGAPVTGYRARIRTPQGWTATDPQQLNQPLNKANFKFTVGPGTFIVTLEDAAGHSVSAEAVRSLNRQGDKGYWRWDITFVKQ